MSVIWFLWILKLKSVFLPAVFLYVLILKALLKICLVLLVLALSIEESLNSRWCNSIGSTILNPPVFFPLPLPRCYCCGITRSVALQWQHICCFIPTRDKGKGVHGVKVYCGFGFLVCLGRGRRVISYLKFSFVPHQHLMSTSNPIQTGSASSLLV